VRTPDVERLREEDFELVRPLLAELYSVEQGHYDDHPQLSPNELQSIVGPIPSRFVGENVIFAVRAADGAVAGFCWCVLFDPGTGLEGEVAEVYVSPDHRREGIAAALLERAVSLFRERGVTLGYVWTRDENEAAVNVYRKAGFETNRQLVLTWYPS
jgi:ribosomal protein S18 acetylase RimI-like enzyme